MSPTDPDREETMPTAAPREAVSEPACRIECTDDEFVVRIPRGLLPDDEIKRFLAVLSQEAIRQKSQMTDEDVMRLADEVDRAVWERVRREIFGEE